MTLPASGLIGLANVNVEILNTATDTLDLNNADVRSLTGKFAGQISLGDCRGKTWISASEQTFTTPGVYTFVVPNYQQLTISLKAGGGGGAGGYSNDGFAYGYNGGNGGAGSESFISIPHTDTQTTSTTVAATQLTQFLTLVSNFIKVLGIAVPTPTTDTKIFTARGGGGGYYTGGGTSGSSTVGVNGTNSVNNYAGGGGAGGAGGGGNGGPSGAAGGQGGSLSYTYVAKTDTAIPYGTVLKITIGDGGDGGGGANDAGHGAGNGVKGGSGSCIINWY